MTPRKPVIINDLERLIPQYFTNKKELEDYKKICNRENLQIKALMEKFKMTRYENKTGEYKALYSVQHRESINEEKLLEIIHNAPEIEHLKSQLIKTKEYIDFDALEKAIYDNVLPKETLLKIDEAREIKEVVTLKVAPIKNKEA